MPTGGVDLGIGTLLSGALGSTAGGLIADAGVGALGGGALGGITSGLEGGNIGQGLLHGAEGGALTGGGIGLGGDIAGSLGATSGSIGNTIGDVLGGAGGGAIGSKLTGGNAATGALEGAASGGLAGLTSQTPTSGTGSGGAGPSGSAGSAAPPPSVPVSGGGDATLSSNPFNVSQLNTSGIDSLASQTSQLPDVNALAASNPTTPGQITADSSTLGGGSSSFINANAPSASTSGIGNVPDNSALASNVQSNTAASFNNGTPATGGTSGGTNNPFNVTPLNTSGIDSLASQTASAGGSGGASTPNVSSGKAFLNNPSVSSFTNMLESNPAADISALGLGYNAIEGNKALAGEGALRTEANQAGQQGQQLESYLQSGTLPPGVSAALNQAGESAKAAIRSRYAQMGSSGSSAEQQELASVDQNTQAQGAQIAMQLLQQGVSETGLSASLYNDIIKNAMTQDEGLSSAFGNFASSLAGGVGGGQKFTISPTTSG